MGSDMRITLARQPHFTGDTPTDLHDRTRTLGQSRIDALEDDWLTQLSDTEAESLITPHLDGDSDEEWLDAARAALADALDLVTRGHRYVANVALNMPYEPTDQWLWAVGGPQVDDWTGDGIGDAFAAVKALEVTCLFDDPITPAEYEASQKACHECGEMMTITTDGISHHITADGSIDYDADADHVAIDDSQTGL